MNRCEFLQLFPGPFTLYTSQSMSLADFQKLGIFTNNPSQPVNDFDEKELINYTFTVYEGEKYLIRKGSTILACSPN